MNISHTTHSPWFVQFAVYVLTEHKFYTS